MLHLGKLRAIFYSILLNFPPLLCPFRLAEYNKKLSIGTYYKFNSICIVNYYMNRFVGKV